MDVRQKNKSESNKIGNEETAIEQDSGTESLSKTMTDSLVWVVNEKGEKITKRFNSNCELILHRIEDESGIKLFDNNGFKAIVKRDDMDRLERVDKYNNDSLIEVDFYSYNGDSIIQIETINADMETSRIKEYLNGNLINHIKYEFGSKTYVENQVFDKNSNLLHKYQYFEKTGARTYDYEYDDHSNEILMVQKSELAKPMYSESKYDSKNRITQFTQSQNNEIILKREFSYSKKGDTLITKESNSNGGSSIYKSVTTNEGNEIYFESGKNEYSIKEYDSKGRLILEIEKTGFDLPYNEYHHFYDFDEVESYAKVSYEIK